MSTLAASLLKSWYRPLGWTVLLWPLSLLYRCIIGLRQGLYRLGIFKIHHFDIPVVIVGNLTVGGVGKTPFIIALTKRLNGIGLKPGVVSRGYGGSYSGASTEVSRDSDPAIVGDEPILIAQKTGCPVVVAHRREEAVKFLISRYKCNIILSDDGLQHYSLNRDIEIAILDAQRGLGNKLCLPAGPLREPRQRLKHVDFIFDNDMHWNMERILSEPVSLVDSTLKWSDTLTFAREVQVVTGIGHPERFFSEVSAFLGIQTRFSKKAYPDHYPFQSDDFSDDPNVVFLMTQKDAIKCKSFADERYWFLPLEIHLPENFFKELLDKVESCYHQANCITQS